LSMQNLVSAHTTKAATLARSKVASTAVVSMVAHYLGQWRHSGPLRFALSYLKSVESASRCEVPFAPKKVATLIKCSIMGSPQRHPCITAR
jgi:hypothetical protein